MVLSIYEKQRILFYNSKGLQPSQIVSALKVEDIRTTRQTVARFIRRFQQTKTIARKEGSGRPSKITPQVRCIVDQAMKNDDETTAIQLHKLLTAQGISISFSTIIRCRSMLGWTFRGSKYCQLIRRQNKIRRFIWACDNLNEAVNNGFSDVIWTDKTTVQLESHRRHSFRKKGEPAALKPRPKHPIKLHVWAGISRKGPTSVAIFEGIMDAEFYISLLRAHLLPCIREKFPDHHKLMQDNDPKHTSKAAKQFFDMESVNWWKTPPESPDMNPIENLWHELKEFIRREVRPTTKTELVAGIKQFWDTVDVAKCNKYINHLRKVVPKVISLDGAATGY